MWTAKSHSLVRFANELFTITREVPIQHPVAFPLIELDALPHFRAFDPHRIDAEKPAV